MSLGTILVIVLILMLVGGIPTSGYGLGNVGHISVGTLLLVVLLLLLIGKI